DFPLHHHVVGEQRMNKRQRPRLHRPPRLWSLRLSVRGDRPDETKHQRKEQMGNDRNLHGKAGKEGGGERRRYGHRKCSHLTTKKRVVFDIRNFEPPLPPTRSVSEEENAFHFAYVSNLQVYQLGRPGKVRGQVPRNKVFLQISSDLTL